MTSLRAQISDKDKALRGAKSQMQEAQDEVVKITDKLAEVKSQKNKFSRLAREKGEEIGELGAWLFRVGFTGHPVWVGNWGVWLFRVGFLSGLVSWGRGFFRVRFKSHLAWVGELGVWPF